MGVMLYELCMSYVVKFRGLGEAGDLHCRLHGEPPLPRGPAETLKKDKEVGLRRRCLPSIICPDVAKYLVT